jgi:hypothetical protein
MEDRARPGLGVDGARPLDRRRNILVRRRGGTGDGDMIANRQAGRRGN